MLTGHAPGLYSQDADSLRIVTSISFSGNKVTRANILERELMFAAGDTLTLTALREKVELTRENLINTSLFNFVVAKVEDTDGWHVSVNYELTERWYIWPWPIIEFADRNINTWWRDSRDLSRMSYGMLLKWENFRGRKEKLYLTARFGYNEKYGFDYTLPYLNRKETIGLGLGMSYGRSHEVPVNSIDNILLYYKDVDNYVISLVNAYISLIYRREIYNTHYFSLSFDYQDYADTVLQLNPEFSVNQANPLEFLSLSYIFKSDHRDNKAYPLSGHYFDLEVVKHGLGLFSDGPDMFSVSSTFRKYFTLSKRFYFASGLNSRFTNNSAQPFLMSGTIGYGRDIVRGYEYFVIHGYNLGIFKNNLKFALVPVKDYDLGFIRSEKFSKVHYAFYLNAFLDVGYADNPHPVPENDNYLENDLLIGYGLGLDFVTYYDIVFRFEYSFNRLNESGFFIHFIAPI